MPHTILEEPNFNDVLISLSTFWTIKRWGFPNLSCHKLPSTIVVLLQWKLPMPSWAKVAKLHVLLLTSSKLFGKGSLYYPYSTLPISIGVFLSISFTQKLKG